MNFVAQMVGWIVILTICFIAVLALYIKSIEWCKNCFKNRKGKLMEREPTNDEIHSACLYYDHSYGLMDASKREHLQFVAKEWLRSWQKVEEDNR